MKKHSKLPHIPELERTFIMRTGKQKNVKEAFKNNQLLQALLSVLSSYFTATSQTLARLDLPAGPSIQRVTI